VILALQFKHSLAEKRVRQALPRSQSIAKVGLTMKESKD